ncbi:MAG: excisionase [Betaproteobacteria bacterium]|nr:excisionase [Betaproteobacteria bacterium]
MKITLEAWASRHFDPPPKISTLRAWAGSGLIVPAPIKVGRLWMVEDEAEYSPTSRQRVHTQGLSDRALSILTAA